MPAIQYSSPKHTCAFVTDILHIIPKGSSINYTTQLDKPDMKKDINKRKYMRVFTFWRKTFSLPLVLFRSWKFWKELPEEMLYCFWTRGSITQEYRKQMRGTNNTSTVVPSLGRSSVSQLSLWKDDISQVLS